jgi:hypothetical protein
MKKTRKKKILPRATVRAYNLILSFDTTEADENLMAEFRRILNQINELLLKNIKDTLPQISLDENRSIKLGVKLYNADDLE